MPERRAGGGCRCNRFRPRCIYVVPLHFRPASATEIRMNFYIMIPITMFVCIAYSIKSVVDAGARDKLLSAGASEELVRTTLLSEEAQRRNAGLRWGVLLLSLAVGFSLVEAFGWDEVTPGVIAVLLGATGVGNLVSYALAQRMK